MGAFWLLVTLTLAGCGLSAPAGTPATASAAAGQPASAGTTTTGAPAARPGATGTAAATGSATATAVAARPATPTATATTATTAPAASGPQPAASSPASVPAALRGVEAMRFASPATAVSSGPDPGDVAVVTANQNLHIFLAGVPQPVVPLVNFADWVPDSDWVIASRLSQPTIQGSTVLGYDLRLAGDGHLSPIPLPTCTDAPPQGVLGPAVAFACGRTLEVAHIGIGGLAPPRTYAWTAGLDAARFVLNPAGTLVAAVLARSCYVRAFKLATEDAWPGTYTAANPNCPDALAWSANGTLAIAAFPGVTIWSPGHVATFARDGDFHALLWTAGGLLAISGTPGNPPWADIIAPDGTARAVTAPSAHVLGFTAGGGHAWTAVSFPGNPATYGIAATGA